MTNALWRRAATGSSIAPLKQGIEASGPIEVTLSVSSDAKDTGFTVKIIDVLADGTASQHHAQRRSQGSSKPGLFCSGRWRDTCSRSGSPGRLTKFSQLDRSVLYSVQS
ncbi:MAG TPA: CocE/NonD family hydrolase C-terminal non-catalytic domain-containing protein [Terracidiphilus sp.]